MAITPFTTEPRELRAGDTWQWRRDDLADYPAPAWVLTYYVRSSAQYFDIVAAADGAAHSVTVAKATTATRFAGEYDWIAVVSSATERHEIGRGRLTVLPDFSAAVALDARSFARKLLDAVEAALLGRATVDQLDVIDATFADRGIKRSDGGLIKLRSQLLAEVRREENAEAMRQGLPSRNRLLVRFGRG
jgi:hypothetical protein